MKTIIQSAENWSRPTLGQDQNVAETVSTLLSNIRAEGVSKIDEIALSFDKQTPRKIELKPFDKYPIDSELKIAIRESATRIKQFARFQKEDIGSRQFKDETGTYGQVIQPIENAGCYIPGGRHPLISTALMTLIPAKVAGCKKRIAVSPSDHPAILAAASLAGATEFLQIGGVQAIAALAYGYHDIKPVDIVVGPGNAYVNEAKAQLQRQVKIDGLAGPSEMLALCDSEQNVEWLAYDALAQSEHDPMALSVLVSDSETWLKKVEEFLLSNEKFKPLVENNQVALIACASVKQMIGFSDQFAPEHLMLCDDRIKPNDLSHFGSLFVGANSAVAFGDYCSGPNHTLPTIGYARQTGGLNVQTFLRIQTIQNVSDMGRNKLAEIAMPLAEAEGLNFHHQSMAVRRDN